jgi:hypothetical protein
VPCRALGNAPSVDEHEGRAVCGRKLRQPRIDLLPHFVRHHRLKRQGRYFDGEIAVANVTGVHDGARTRLVRRRHPDQEPRNLVDGLLRRR